MSKTFKDKPVRNWHAVNAFGRHAGPMRSEKRPKNRAKEQLSEEIEDFRENFKDFTPYSCNLCLEFLDDCTCDEQEFSKDN